MLDFLTDDIRRDPYPLYTQMRAASPLLCMPPTGPYLVFDYAGVKRVLDDHEAFSSSASPAGMTDNPLPWMIFQDPPRHTKLRALVSRAFTPRSIAALEPRIASISSELLDAVIARGTAEFDLVADYAAPLPMMVIAEMLGIPSSDRARFKRWSDAILGLSETISGGPAAGAKAGAQYRATTEEMEEYLIDVLREFRTAPKDNLLNRLALAEVDGERLTHREILGFFQLLLLAGSETTINLIANAILCLLEHPDQLARLRAEMDMLPSAIEEVLRYRSPLQAVFRGTRREVEMHGGQVIPARKLVLVMIGSANRDAAVFGADAERFDITRDASAHIGFGHGNHFCLGAALARMEARVAVSDLLARLRTFSRADDEPWPPNKAFHVLGPAQLALRFDVA
jgi:cytochrome P450